MQESNLASVLQERLQRIDGARTLVVNTFDGVELFSVSSRGDVKNREELPLINQYSSSCAIASEQVAKLGFGSSKYSLSWLPDGILLQTKLEAAVLSLYFEDDANLGLLDDQLDIIVKILQPFTTANFISTNLL